MKRPPSPWLNPAICARARELATETKSRDIAAELLSSEFDVRISGAAFADWLHRSAKDLLKPQPERQKPVRNSYAPLPAPKRNANRLATLFTRKRVDIPESVRTANVTALLGAAKKLTVKKPAISADFRHQAALWAGCETSFAAYDVEAANPITASYDARPFNWAGLRHATAVPTISPLGAAAGSW